MSLINKMLQDLDRRNASAPGTGLSLEAKPLRAPRGAAARIWLWLIAAVVLLGAGLGWQLWQSQRSGAATKADPSPPAVLAPAQPAPVPLATTEPSAPAPAAAASLPQQADPARMASAPVPVPTAPAPSAGSTRSPAASATTSAPATPATASAPSPSAIPGGAPGPSSDKVADKTTDKAASAPQPPASPLNAAQAPPPASPAPLASIPPPRIVIPDPPLRLPELRPQAARAPAAAPREAKLEKRDPATPREQAEVEYRRGVSLVNQGRVAEGMDALRAALSVDPGHEPPRQMLVALLVEARRIDEAGGLLLQALEQRPGDRRNARLLARIQLERGDVAGALAILQKHAGEPPREPEYQALTAAVLQRLTRHREAAEEYLGALRTQPGNGNWWVGAAISLDAIGRGAEAVDALRRARIAGNLSPDVAEYVEQRLRAAAQ